MKAIIHHVQVLDNTLDICYYVKVMTNIQFTNTDNFTINDPEQFEAYVEALERAMKRQALIITFNNAKELICASFKATLSFLDRITKPGSGNPSRTSE